jgi:hypothetical protein
MGSFGFALPAFVSHASLKRGRRGISNQLQIAAL